MRIDETSLSGCRVCVLKPLLLASFACLLIARAANAQQQVPELLTYDELVQLYEQETPPDEVERTVAFVGKFKLDWVFVKPPALTEPYDQEGAHRFAPHFGRTLKSLNNAVTERVSDHSPMMVDLPLGEPRIVRGERRRAAAR